VVKLQSIRIVSSAEKERRHSLKTTCEWTPVA